MLIFDSEHFVWRAMRQLIMPWLDRMATVLMDNLTLASRKADVRYAADKKT